MENNNQNDFSDLEPIVMNKATGYAPRKPVSNEISFGPITAERIMYVVVALLVVSMLVPWLSMRYTLFGMDVELTIKQIESNTFDAIWVLAVAVLTIVASFRDNIRYLLSSVILFAFSAWRVINTSKRVVQAQGLFGVSIEVHYHLGFYLYIAAAILMIIAVILRLIDKDR